MEYHRNSLYRSNKSTKVDVGSQFLSSADGQVSVLSSPNTSGTNLLTSRGWKASLARAEIRTKILKSECMRQPALPPSALARARLGQIRIQLGYSTEVECVANKNRPTPTYIIVLISSRKLAVMKVVRFPLPVPKLHISDSPSQV